MLGWGTSFLTRHFPGYIVRRLWICLETLIYGENAEKIDSCEMDVISHVMASLVTFEDGNVLTGYGEISNLFVPNQGFHLSSEAVLERQI
jgi:hypothetical protein